MPRTALLALVIAAASFGMGQVTPAGTHSAEPVSNVAPAGSEGPNR
jgi:hypothetical protein